MTKELNKLELYQLEQLHKSATPANWLPKDLGQAAKKNEDLILMVELRNKAEQLISMAKAFLHAEKWYAIRFRQLRDLCEQNNLLTEFCNIMANGSHDMASPKTYQQIVNSLEFEIEKLKKEKCILQSQIDEFELSKLNK